MRESQVEIKTRRDDSKAVTSAYSQEMTLSVGEGFF